MTPKSNGKNQPRRFNLQNQSLNLEIDHSLEAQNDVQTAVLLTKTSRKWSLLTWFIAIFLLFFGFLLLVDFAKNAIWLFEQHSILGYIGTSLASIFVLLLVSLIVREWRALSRLNQMVVVQSDAHHALKNDNTKLADTAAEQLLSLYKKALQQHPHNLSAKSLEPLDGLEKLALIETELLRALDKNVNERIIQATRDSAVFTTISPFALLDVLISLWRNLKMIREIAQVYGMAPGWFQTAKLLRRAIGQVVIAGGMEAGDGLLQSLFGSSLAGKISTKVGEGLVNGLMTARLGIATAELCRPLPYALIPKPKLHEIAGAAMKRINSSE